MVSARVWEDNFSDLGKTSHFQIKVEGDMVRGISDLQNPAVVCPEIKWSNFEYFLVFYYYGVFQYKNEEKQMSMD